MVRDEVRLRAGLETLIVCVQLEAGGASIPLLVRGLVAVSYPGKFGLDRDKVVPAPWVSRNNFGDATAKCQNKPIQMLAVLRAVSKPKFIPLTAIRKFNFRPMEILRDTAPNGAAQHAERKRPFPNRNNQGGRGNKRQKIFKQKPVKEGSTEEVLILDVAELFAKQSLNEPAAVTTETTNGATEDGQQDPAQPELPAPFTEIDVKVLEISSTGDGLAVAPGSNQIYVVPFTAPGDIARVKVIKHFEQLHYTLTDYLSIVEPSPLRDDSRINCKYFSKCSGCQFQMLDYATQLKHKRSIVEKAYKNFSNLPTELVPSVIDTMGSPLQYEYRTKLTPHFDGPPGHRSRVDARNGIKKVHEVVPPIGFMLKGRRATLDIEDCPIGTPAVRAGMKRERIRVANEIHKYSKGATLLLRESTTRILASQVPETIPEDTVVAPVAGKDLTDLKVCITDSNSTSNEYIDSADASYTFTNRAGEFFQNNNSILPPFTQYIRENIFPPSSPTEKSVQYLIDAYSGSGLFTITLSSQFKSSMGIDISAASIASASQNAALNNIAPERASFMAADAPELFKKVTYPADETVVVIDPPRKGCDDSFLKQLLNFGPRRVVYVSCNVHTQARDVGVMVHGYVNGKDARGGLGRRYKLESLRGFDFFPQTGHVEGVAVLSRVDEMLEETVEDKKEVPKEVLEKDVADAEGVIATGAVTP